MNTKEPVPLLTAEQAQALLEQSSGLGHALPGTMIALKRIASGAARVVPAEAQGAEPVMYVERDGNTVALPALREHWRATDHHRINLYLAPPAKPDDARDAERGRWLVKQFGRGFADPRWFFSAELGSDYDTADEAIDAAMKAQP